MKFEGSGNLDDSISNFIAAVKKKGVQIWVEHGRLRYRAPRGVLTRTDMELLRVSKEEIITQFQNAETRVLGRNHHSRSSTMRSPLAFSQLAHWHMYCLWQRRAVKQIVSATRILGRVNACKLEESIASIIRRHDALRTKVVSCGNSAVQEIHDVRDWKLHVETLASMSHEERELAVIRLLEKEVLEPIDVAKDWLLGVKLIQCDQDEHVLIVAMEHMISDACSMGILLQEVFTSYAQLVRCREVSLPAVNVQFPEYSVWVRRTHLARENEHGRYWTEHVLRHQRLRLFGPRPQTDDIQLGWDSVPLQLMGQERTSLLEWCRRMQTTLVMSMLTVYVALVLRWTRVVDTVIQYQSDLRDRPEVSGTIGFISTPLYLSVTLLDDDSFVSLLHRLTEEYCRAHEHADFSFMEASLPRPEVTRNTAFNWIPRSEEIKISELSGSKEEIRCSAIPFTHPVLKVLERDTEPFLLLYDDGEKINGGMYFARCQCSREQIMCFVRSFYVLLRGLLDHPRGPVKDLLLT